MQRKLYFVKIQGKRDIYNIIIAAFNEINAKAIAEEYFENKVMEIRLCTFEDVNNIEDKRIMHMSHIMTPLDRKIAERYGVKKEAENEKI